MMNGETIDSTREQLILCAIEQFGRHGYEGASTRDIATAAGRPMSAITYHFGGKHGLFLEAARHISMQIRHWFEPAMHAIRDQDAPNPQEARAMLEGLLTTAVGILTRHDIEAFARFIIREQSDPTEAFTIIYDGFMGPLLAQIVGLVGAVTEGRTNGREARLWAVMLVGQVVQFRVSRAVVMRTMGWKDIGEQERGPILSAMRTNLHAVLDALIKENER